MGHLTTENEEGSLKVNENSSTGSIEDIGGQHLSDNYENQLGDENESETPTGTPFYLTDDFLSAEFSEETRELTRDIVQYICQHENFFPAANRTIQVMRALVDDALMNRLDFMRDLSQKLDIKSCEQLSLLDRLVTEMFDDDIVTWGRIVTLFAFSGYLARHCEQQLLISGSAECVMERLSNIVIGRLGLWIVANGGWAAFQGQFPAVCIFDSSTLWKMAGFVGLLCGGVFAFYSSLQLINP